MIDSSHNNFAIIFERLEHTPPKEAQLESPTGPEAPPAEIDEIAELRRIVLEITDPEQISFTST